MGLCHCGTVKLTHSPFPSDTKMITCCCCQAGSCQALPIFLSQGSQSWIHEIPPLAEATRRILFNLRSDCMWLAPREAMTVGSVGYEGSIQVGAGRERTLLCFKQREWSWGHFVSSFSILIWGLMVPSSSNRYTMKVCVDYIQRELSMVEYLGNF